MDRVTHSLFDLLTEVDVRLGSIVLLADRLNTSAQKYFGKKSVFQSLVNIELKRAQDIQHLLDSNLKHIPTPSVQEEPASEMLTKLNEVLHSLNTKGIPRINYIHYELGESGITNNVQNECSQNLQLVSKYESEIKELVNRLSQEYPDLPAWWGRGS